MIASHLFVSVAKQSAINLIVVIVAASIAAWAGDGAGLGFNVFWGSLAVAAIVWPIGRRGRRLERSDWRAIAFAVVIALVGAVVTVGSVYGAAAVFPAYWSAVIMGGVPSRYFSLWFGLGAALGLAALGALALVSFGLMGAGGLRAFLPVMLVGYLGTVGLVALGLRCVRRARPRASGSLLSVVAAMALSAAFTIVVQYAVWVPILRGNLSCAYQVAFNNRSYACTGDHCWCGRTVRWPTRVPSKTRGAN